MKLNAQTIDLPRRTFKDSGEIDVWLNSVGKLMKEALEKGPIVIR
jgi:hypothetical protein